MSDQSSIYDPVTACYDALKNESDADTCCKRMCVIIRRMQRDGLSTEHDSHFMTLANQLFAKTNSFGLYITEIYACMLEEDYDTAVQIGDAMLQHETMLQEIATGQSIRRGATLN